MDPTNTHRSCVVSAAFEPIGSPSTTDKLARLDELLLYKTVSVDERRDGHFIPLDRSWWYRNFGRDYLAIQELALRTGMIEANTNERGTKRYSSNAAKAPNAGRSFCCSFRLSDDFRDGKSKIFELRRKPRNITQDTNQLSPAGRELSKRLCCLQINPEAAKNVWDQLAATYFARGFHRPYECDYGRFHSALTGISKQARKTLSSGGSISNKYTHMRYVTEGAGGAGGPSGLFESSSCRFIGLDVSNCQPLCLAIECLKYSKDRFVMDWLEHAQQGTTYERIQEWLRRGAIKPYTYTHKGLRLQTDPSKWDRDQTKKQFMVGMFGNDNFAPCWIAVGQIWPTVAEIAKQIKKVRYENLAWTCQRIESLIIIQDASMQIMQARPHMPLGTVYDCTYLPESHQDIGMHALNTAFAKHGVRVKINMI